LGWAFFVKWPQKNHLFHVGVAIAAKKMSLQMLQLVNRFVEEMALSEQLWGRVTQILDESLKKPL
jgi:hypothetical protein